MTTQPLVSKSHQLAERLGMTVGELGVRMTMSEMLDWIEYDSFHFDESWYQHAILCAKIDGACGDRRAKAEKYLPKVKTVTKARTLEDVRAHFNSVVRHRKPKEVTDGG